MHSSPRQFILIKDLKNLPHFELQSAVWIGGRSSPPHIAHFSFRHSSNLLGQEFEHIVFDAREGFNVDALAIASGTLKAGGTLFFIEPNWQSIDQDSIRWSGVEQGIHTPHFNRWFLTKFTEYSEKRLVGKSDTLTSKPYSMDHQQAIIDEILQQQADLYFLTAKRGRGKSALAGMLSKQLKQRLYLTAPNKSAVSILQGFAGNSDLHFIAPDLLAAQIQQNPQQFVHNWLIVDEAAMLPLALLQIFTQSFKHILFTTTVQSYEGTGLGFTLKFQQKTDRTSQSFTLTTPFRWAENDPLEQFIDALLLLDAEEQVNNFPDDPQTLIEYQQAELIQNPTILNAFYGLLSLAHYRTSLIDLRRLFDAPQQRFWLAQGQPLSACIWTLEEGNIRDPNLIQAIKRGLRRPKGNLIPQLLCFQGGLTQACTLKSLRISRIALHPKKQNQGQGKKLITQLIQAVSADYDFLSVSFGYTSKLAAFWQKCGFQLVYLGDHLEASSGCHNAIMLYPLSTAGKQLVLQGHTQFQRNIALLNHPLAEQFQHDEIDWEMNEQDWQTLHNFANYHRTLYVSSAAIQRLLKHYPKTNLPLLREYFQGKKDHQLAQKAWLIQCRQEAKTALNNLPRAYLEES